ncbi:MAG: IS1595 family transposase [Pirellulales bacterium]
MFEISLGVSSAISASSLDGPESSPSDLLGGPAVLQEFHVQELLAAFFAEYDPVGPTETALVRDLARQAAAMEIWGQSAGASFRQAVAGISALLVGAQAYAGNLDAMLASAAASESTERSSRHHLGHSRAFYRALQKLRELQAWRKSLGSASHFEPPESFETEAACEAYLAARFSAGHQRCPRCGGASGYFLPKRRVWECGGCKSQVGLRAGTVMAGSRLSLMVWFEAIRWLLWAPTISASELGHKLGIQRLTTVRKMAAKIRAAMADDQATEMLAGLDEHFRQRALAPESGAPLHKYPRASDDVQNTGPFIAQPKPSQALTDRRTREGVCHAAPERSVVS